MQTASITQTSNIAPVTTLNAVPCLDGIERPALNFDHAATTPPLAAVVDAVQALLPWYGSVQRGAGHASEVATAALEGARAAIGEFVGADERHTVVLTRNATEAINVLAAAFPPGTTVLTSPVEHHANLLPWTQRHDAVLLPFPASPDDLLATLDRTLAGHQRRIKLVALTGASNVTGERWPITELAAVAHAHDAELLIDAAQLVPHAAVDLRASGIDHVAFSGHKLYAPYGAGALVALRSRLEHTTPMLLGGGAVTGVTLDNVDWAPAPRRNEAGTPNLLGAVALGVAADHLAAVGMAQIEVDELRLARLLRTRLAAVPGVRLLQLWPEQPLDTLGTVSFLVAERRPALVAAALGAEHGIAVRSGRFCAHPLVNELTRRAGLPPGSGAVRASIGLTTRDEDVDALATAVAEIVEHGPREEYVNDPRGGPPRPLRDARTWPRLPFRLVRDNG